MRFSIRHPFALSCCLRVALFFDGTGIIRCCLFAIVLHEAGHAALYTLLLHRRPVFRIGFGGIALYWQPQRVRPAVQALVLLAGPAANLLSAWVCFRITAERMQLSWLLFGGVSLLLGLFNLLPLGFLDGGRLFSLVLEKFLPAERAMKCCECAQTVCLGALSLFLLAVLSDRKAQISLILFLCYYSWKSFFTKN